MIRTNDLLNIFIALEWDIPNQTSILINKTLARPSIPGSDRAEDRAGETFYPSLFWLFLRRNGPFWADPCAGFAINTDI
jgi:hypothetical protein